MTIVFAAPATSYTVADIMQETKRTLDGTARQEINELSAAMLATDTTFSTSFDLEGISRGSFLAVDDEVMYVWGVDLTGNVITVRRGMLGTEPAAHEASALIEVNPRYPNYAVRYALREEIRSWGPQVYTVKSTTIQTVEDTRGYDLGTLVADNFYQIMSVRASTPTTTGMPDPMSWPRIENWHVMRGAPTSDFPSGTALVIPDAYYSGTKWASSDGVSLQFTSTPLPTLSVLYSAPFNVNTFEDKTDMVLEVGLDVTMLDIPAKGAAWRLMSQKEPLRLQTEAQAQPYDLQFSPPMYASKAAAAMKADRDSRLNDAQIWLMNRYGIENWGT